MSVINEWVKVFFNIHLVWVRPIIVSSSSSGREVNLTLDMVPPTHTIHHSWSLLKVQLCVFQVIWLKVQVKKWYISTDLTTSLNIDLFNISERVDFQIISRARVGIISKALQVLAFLVSISFFVVWMLLPRYKK